LWGVPPLDAESSSLPKPLRFQAAVKCAAGGEDFLAVVTIEGGVYSVGNALDGRLGLGLDRPAKAFTQIGGLENVTKVSCGKSHSAALTADGKVAVWGNGREGALGAGDAETYWIPYWLTFARPVSWVSCGSRHTGFVVDAELFMCGSSDTGQLGTGRRDREYTPVKIPIPEQVSSVACGIFHTLILAKSGKVYATGGNTFGQLGDGSKRSVLKPIELKTINKVQQVSCSHHSAAVTMTGHLYLWGTGVFGEFLAPKLVLSERIVHASVGGCSGVATDSFGRVWAWGSNSNGELGLGDYEARKTPTQITKLTTVSAAISGGSYTFAYVQGTHQPDAKERRIFTTPQFKASGEWDSKVAELEAELREEVSKRHSLAEENRRLIRRLERPIDITSLEERLERAQKELMQKTKENENLKDEISYLHQETREAKEARGKLEEQLVKVTTRLRRLERKPPPLMSPESENQEELRSQASTRQENPIWFAQSFDIRSFASSRARPLSRISQTTQGSSAEPTARSQEQSPPTALRASQLELTIESLTSPSHVSLQDFKTKLAAIQSNKLALEAKMTEFERKMKARRCS